MPKRYDCLYNNEIIHISSIYDVDPVTHKQINKPGEVEKLRKLGRDGLLTCSCGCGMKLTLVAGDKGLREQHFRQSKGQSETFFQCSATEESEESRNAKTVLHLWLKDKLDHTDLKNMVPLNTVEKNKHRFEMAVYSPDRKIGVIYSRKRENLSDDKLSSLIENYSDIKQIMVVGERNQNDSGQFPEWMMKVQTRQGYCFFLSVADGLYENAVLTACVYSQGLDKLWYENHICEAPLSQYLISDDGVVSFGGKSLAELTSVAIEAFNQSQAKTKQNKEDEENRRIEYYRQLKEQQKEEERKRLEHEAELERQKEERRREQEARYAACLKRQEELKAQRPVQEVYLSRKEEKAIVLPEAHSDEKQYTCYWCGKTGGGALFAMTDAGNLKGVCKDCSNNGRNSPEVEAILKKASAPKKPVPVSCKFCGNRNIVTTNDNENEVIDGELRGVCKYCAEKRITKIGITRYAKENLCPRCGGALVCQPPRKKGSTYFIGCSNFRSGCRYSLSVNQIPDKYF